MTVCASCAQAKTAPLLAGWRHSLLASRTGTSRNVEDRKHFLVERPVYDDLRAACPAFPVGVYSTLSDPDCVALVMGHDAQAALANTLYRMKAVLSTRCRNIFPVLLSCLS